MLSSSDTKRVLNTTADLLASGALRWTREYYILDEEYDIDLSNDLMDAQYGKVEPPSIDKLKACPVCALGACAIVGIDLGLIDPKQAYAISVVERSIDNATGVPNMGGQIIRFNDDEAVDVNEVADKLREVAGRIAD